ncbi:hypothetical protein HWV62_23320 [Athelia sp. TMB]|nr:hypothetical protein HWV62_23320 [Athelia sp. TMB]
MAAVMRPPAQLQYQYSPRARPSILINTAPPAFTPPAAKRISTTPTPTPSHHSLASSSDSSSSSSSAREKTSASASSSLPSRRIRFAPLPDPRLLDESPDDAHPHPASLGASPAPLELTLDTGSDAGSLLAPGSACASRQSSPLTTSRPLDNSDFDVSRNESTATLPDPVRADTGLTPTPSHASTITSSWSKPKRLFKPFMRKPKAASTEDSTTLGLFRSSSTSTASSEDGAGPLSLGRWTSAGSGGKARAKEWFGSPLARTESTHSLKSPPPSSSLSPRTPTSPAGKRAKGTRMLNGRVYGGRRALQNSNLFATAKDEEPSFVEWGYGGMGAVRSNSGVGAHGSKWARVQGGGALGGARGEDDDDDGGGMAWARKRKEARERAAREAEEKKNAPPVADAPAEKPAETPTPAPTPEHDLRTVPVPVQPTSPTTPTTPSTASASPVAPRPAYHLRTRSGSGSASLISLPSPGEEKGGERAMSPLRLPSFGSPLGEGSGSGSTSEEEEAGSDDEGDDEGDGEEEEEERQRQRATALGAGVEKVSRHKEHEEGIGAI